MQSTVKPKSADDPHDVLVVPSDLVRVVPGEEEVSSLLREAARQKPAPQVRPATDVATTPPVPPVDTTFRATAIGDGPGQWRSGGQWVGRVFAALLLLACIGAAAAWQSNSEAAKQIIANSTPKFLLSLWGLERPGSPVQAPAAETTAVNAEPPEPAALQSAPAQAAPQATTDAAAPAASVSSPDQAQMIQSMAKDIASLTQQVGELKASIEQLKAGQQQISHDVVKPSEPGPRPKLTKLSPPRPAARPRPPVQTYYPPPPTQIAPPLPQAGAPRASAAPYYAPRQAEPPRGAIEPPDEPDPSSVPRPPMPLR